MRDLISNGTKVRSFITEKAARCWRKCGQGLFSSRGGCRKDREEQEAWVEEGKGCVSSGLCCPALLSSSVHSNPHGGRWGGPGARAVGVPCPSAPPPGPVRRAGPASLSKKEEVGKYSFHETSHWIQIWVRFNGGNVRKKGPSESWISRLGNRNQRVEWMHSCQ